VFWGLWIAVWIAIEDFYTLTHTHTHTHTHVILGFHVLWGPSIDVVFFYNVLTVYYFPIH